MATTVTTTHTTTATHGTSHAHDHAAHTHGTMDVQEHERMFGYFVQFLAWNAVAMSAVLIFLALANS
ncbi:aa3-type cytochrome c oxidase subunit IV [Paracoccus suum]|uniref:Aa3-type cytochrome c oxidase subunit IV n=1 Tax=Paracoccus suum TaxID=2259340 RepID=A0A344PHB1_9RHOB|nr:aa3-type cytochrome c oxidase subunit IV [Paracoccus suum]AXC48766.1 aa3-type cytochrome c oxidase subunit IV [Paracoccus suum]